MGGKKKKKRGKGRGDRKKKNSPSKGPKIGFHREVGGVGVVLLWLVWEKGGMEGEGGRG